MNKQLSLTNEVLAVSNVLIKSNKLVHLVLAEEKEQHENKEHGMNSTIDNVLQLKGGTKEGQQCIDGNVRNGQRQADEGDIWDGQLKNNQLEVGVAEAVVVNLQTKKL